MNFKYQIAKLETFFQVKLPQWIAWKLPRRVVYFAYIRLHSYATCTKYSDKTPNEVDWSMALNTWETKEREGE